MKLRNLTKWSTDELRELIAATFKAAGVSHAGYLVEVRNTRRGLAHFSGLAWVGRPHLRMCVPATQVRVDKEIAGVEWRPYDFEAVDFVQVLTHEILHTLGLRHREMLGSRLTGAEDCSPYNCEFARGFVVHPGAM
jgi:hypothetical protein